MKLYDEDGIDGPAAKAWKAAEREDKDARAFREGAGAIEALLDVDLPMQLQHYERPRLKRSACGAFGQIAATKSAVTCPACKRHLERKDER